MDSATPYLFLETCCGRGKDVVLELTKTGAGSGADVFMTYTLRNALLSNYDVESSNRRNSRPTELLTLSFVDIEVKYTPYDEGGNALAPLAVGFNTATHERR